jgi:hypothetical protein
MPSYAGKANFSLIAPLVASAATAALRFDVPGLNFRSRDLRLLGRQGAQYVFVGRGMVRGVGGYQFRLSTAATNAGGQGRLALKIWHADPASKNEVVDYDNTRVLAGTDVGRVMAGSIIAE